jgi:Glu-tRNA(Gln) amidotransferase subunit E-like FAD-binding protein
LEAPDVPAVSASAPELPELSKLDEAFKHTSIGKAADEYRARLDIRMLENRIANDPDIMAAKKNAEAAPTDLEKRERLRAYYELLYGRMRRSASSEETRKALNDEQTEHLRMLDQPRVRPIPGGTIPPVAAKSKTEKKKKSHLGRISGN